MMEWQPIETAPKDGRQILAWSGGFTIIAWVDATRGPGVSGYIQKPGWAAFAEGQEIPDEGWDTGNGFTLEVRNPTHWKPLPEPPK